MTRSLIIGDAGFSAADLADLQRNAEHLADAAVVRTRAALEQFLRQSQFLLVVHVCSSHKTAIPPAEAMKAVFRLCREVPYVAVGENLTAAQAVDLIKAGAIDCLAVNDQRSLADVIRNAIGPYRHLRLVPKTAPLTPSQEQVLRALGEGVAVIDRDLRFQSPNPAFETLTGYTAEELSGAPALNLDGGGLKRQLEICKQQLAGCRGEVTLRRKDGSKFPAWVVVSPVPSAGSRDFDGYAVLVSDITARKEQEAEFKRLASFDSLTQLPNRDLLQDRMAQVLANAKRNRTRVAAMFVDLDHFKYVNDTWGHARGDAILIETANRMQACVRESDTVARIGGDEFAVIVTDVSEDRAAEKVAAKIAGALERPFLCDGVANYLSASIGIAIYPLHGVSAETLFANADAAMYEVKRNGRRGYRLFGDTAAVSATGTMQDQGRGLGVNRGQASSLSRTVAEAVSKKIILPPLPLFPAGLAMACIVVLFGWLFTTGMVNFHLASPDDFMSGAEMNSFGTASGGEQMEILPDIPLEPSK
ncbi:MAG: diguanylate cyclase [Rhodospirillales bacterium]|nr:diguanylate cyclase [Rhodospirillales bacterium]